MLLVSRHTAVLALSPQTQSAHINGQKTRRRDIIDWLYLQRYFCCFFFSKISLFAYGIIRVEANKKIASLSDWNLCCVYYNYSLA